MSNRRLWHDMDAESSLVRSRDDSLNASTSVPLALFGAALTLLDDISTSVVAAATASVYITDQAHGVVGAGWMTIVLLSVVTAIGLIGIRGSAGVTLVTLAFHVSAQPMDQTRLDSPSLTISLGSLQRSQSSCCARSSTGLTTVTTCSKPTGNPVSFPRGLRLRKRSTWGSALLSSGSLGKSGPQKRSR